MSALTLKDLFAALHQKDDVKVYASLVREIDRGFTLALAYLVPYPSPPNPRPVKGTLYRALGPLGDVKVRIEPIMMDAVSKQETDGRTSFLGHDDSHWDMTADEGYTRLDGAIRETFMDEVLVERILEGLQQRDERMLSWFGEHGVQLYRRTERSSVPVKSILPAFPPGE